MNDLFNNDNNNLNGFNNPNNGGNNGGGNYSNIQVSAERKRTFKRLFIILIATGLVLGGIFAFAVVKLLNHFGLTDKPTHPQIEFKDQKLQINPL
jgi:hypothetical protein